MFNLVLNIHLVGHLIAIGYYLVSVIEINYYGYENSWRDTVLESEG